MHVWRKATLTFGMVTIPVGVSSAVKEHKHTALHGAHKACGTAVSQTSRCVTCGCDLSQDDIKLVYDVSPNLSLDVPKDQFEKLGLSASSLVQITRTFPLQQLEPELVRKSYYLVPNKDFVAQYELFSQALAQTKLAALSTSVLGGKEYPAAVRSEAGVLTLNLLWCADELVQTDQDFEVLGQKLNPQELSLAKDILRSMTGELTAEDLSSKTWEEQKAFLQALVENRPHEAQEKMEPSAPTVDMLSALKESLKQTKQPKKPARKPAPPRRKRVAA